MKKLLLLASIAVLISVNLFAQPTFLGTSRYSPWGMLSKYDAAANKISLVFDFLNTGFHPTGRLLKASDGKFYGMTNGGGVHSLGTIFSFDSSTSRYTELKSFSGTDGATPWGSLIEKNGKLYGMTAMGGTSGGGVLFCIDLSGASYTVLKNFSGNDGYRPLGSLVELNGKFYGMTDIGGTVGAGVIFSFDPSTSIYTALKSFDISHGANAQGGFTVKDGKLYGLTNDGGSTNNGVIFSFDPISLSYTVLKNFTGADGKNSASNADLFAASDGKLYGMTSNGGSAGAGVLFSLNPSTSAYIVLKNFTTADGSNPSGSLAEINGTLYGMTQNGGSANYGLVFSFNINTAAYNVVRNFDYTGPRIPLSNSLMAANGKLYATTTNGGTLGFGVIFSIDPSNNNYVKLFEYKAEYGSRPSGGLTRSQNGKYYGMAYGGGQYGLGVIFSYDVSTSTFKVEKSFTGNDGCNPMGTTLVERDGILYGMTWNGGIGYGVVFSFNPANAVYRVLKIFNGTDGKYPYGSLTEKDGKFYGMTSEGGSSGRGVIFSFDPSTMTYTMLKNFKADGSDGGSPYGLLTEWEGKLYGMVNGGPLNHGAIFSIDPLTQNYTIVKSFTGPDGAYPSGSLTEKDGVFYGLAAYGGTSNQGVIFSFNPATSAYTLLKSLDSTTGNTPLASLALGSDSKLYGMCNAGGTGSGVIFSFDPSTGVYTKADFNQANGGNPIFNDLVEIGYAGNNSQEIRSINSANGIFCAGDEVTIDFKTTGDYATGNSFTAELSNEQGQFKGSVLTTRSITLVSTVTSGGTVHRTYRLVAQLPLITNITGSNYRLRINAAGGSGGSPVTGLDFVYNETGFTLNPVPTIQTIKGGGIYCTGTPPLMGLTASQDGVNYLLFRYGSSSDSTLVATVPGTGAPINFDPQTAEGMYKVKAIFATGNGCGTMMSGRDSIIRVDAPQVADQPGQSLCNTSSFSITQAAPTAGSIGSWSFVGDHANAQITDSLATSTTVTGVAAGGSVTVRWTVTNGTCSAFDDIQLDNIKADPVNAGADQVQEKNGSFTVSAAKTRASGHWTVTSGTATIADADAATTTITGVPDGTMAVLRWTVTNGPCVNYDEVSLVNTLTSVTVSPDTQQYSDKVSFEANISPALEGSLAPQQAEFYIGQQKMGSTSFFVEDGVSKARLSNIALTETAGSMGEMAPGVHTVTVDITGTTGGSSFSKPTSSITITQEDARATYTGPLTVAAPVDHNTPVKLTLAATIRDITAVAGDPDYDADGGDIRNATVRFFNRETNETLADNVPVLLADAANPLVGMASAEVILSTGAQDYATYTIGIEVKNYYQRNSTSEDAIINVASPLNDFVTGGGYVVLNSSAGEKAGDAGSKNNFGFNVKFNKKGNNLQGNFNSIIRRTEWNAKRSRNELHVYTIKSNSITALSFLPSSNGVARAVFTAKANIREISNGDGGGTVVPNATVEVQVTDNGEPGTNDRISITVWDTPGKLWFASNWNGAAAQQQQLAKGNVQIHSSASSAPTVVSQGGLSTSETVTAKTSTGINLLAFPNPSSSLFTIMIGSADKVNKIQVKVFDIAGRIVQSFDNINAEQTFQLGSGYRRGVYVVQVIQGKEHKQLKLVKIPD